MAAGLNRRDVITGGGTALGWFLIGGSRVWATPATAVAQGFSPQVLTHQQIKALEILGDTLVPGSVEAGLAAFVDAQLEAGPESKLIAKYLGVPVEQQAGFYRAALDAVDTALSNLQPQSLVAAMGADAVSNWTAPPASYVQFVLRADALDVTYGTEAGFELLGIPYSAHIPPESRW